MTTTSTVATAAANALARPSPEKGISADELRRLFRLACDMEDPIATVRDLLRAILAIALSDGALPDDRDVGAVMRLVILSERALSDVEKARGDLFGGLHPPKFGIGLDYGEGTTKTVLDLPEAAVAAAFDERKGGLQ